MHRNTIGCWERGEYLPNSQTTVVELAEALGLDDEDKKKLLDASLQFSIEGSSAGGNEKQPIKPGGVWISPAEGEIVEDTIKFAAFAYPTHPEDPPIEYVNFTIGCHGYWQIAATVYPSEFSPVFLCEIELSKLHILTGQIQVSFDVYDKKGNKNLAPNGVHVIEYRAYSP